jgi:hypothetical protein
MNAATRGHGAKQTPGAKQSQLEEGAGKLTLLVFGSILAAALYTAYNVLPFYYYYYDLKNQFAQVIKVASVESDAEIRKKLMYFIKRYNIPCEPEDLRIERSNGVMRISLKYQEVFYVTWQGQDYTVREFDFDATEEAAFN